MNKGKELFTKLATAANQHGLDEQDSKRFAFIGLSVYAEIMGSKEASEYFQKRADEFKKA